MYRINRGLREWSIDKKLFINEFKNCCQIFEINPLSELFSKTSIQIVNN